VTVLEAARALASGGGLAMPHLLFNVLAVLAALIAAMPLLLRTQENARGLPRI